MPVGSFDTFDKAYLDYAQYERFSTTGIKYVTRLKENVLYNARQEYDIADNADSGILKEEEIILHYG